VEVFSLKYYDTLYFRSKPYGIEWWIDNVLPNGKLLMSTDIGYFRNKITTIKALKRHYTPEEVYRKEVKEEQYWKEFDKWYSRRLQIAKKET